MESEDFNFSRGATFEVEIPVRPIFQLYLYILFNWINQELKYTETKQQWYISKIYENLCQWF